MVFDEFPNDWEVICFPVICITTWVDNGYRAGLGYWSRSSGWDIRWCWWWCPIGDALVIIIKWYDVGAHWWSGYVCVVSGVGCKVDSPHFGTIGFTDAPQYDITMGIVYCDICFGEGDSAIGGGPAHSPTTGIFFTGGR